MKKIKNILIVILLLEIVCFFYNEKNSITITKQEVDCEELKLILSSTRVVQISDLHIKSYAELEKRLIRLLDKLEPDIIFITGDFVSSNKGIEPCIKVLRDIVRERLVIAVLGNSDRSSLGEKIQFKRLIEGFRSIGMKVLINESLKLTVKAKKEKSGNTLYIVGLDDDYLWFDDIFKATINIPEKSPKILLSHTPHIIEKINCKGISLILSGHTHGGQIVIPFIGAVYTNEPCIARRRYVQGLYDEETKLYVNRGIGTSGIPLRLFCRPQITVFEFI
jgi:predicted MPP superfamily phosphohydrolase